MSLEAPQGETFLMVGIIEMTGDTRSIYGHIDFLGKGGTSLLEDVSLANCLDILFLTGWANHRHNLRFEYAKNYLNYISSFFRTFG